MATLYSYTGTFDSTSGSFSTATTDSPIGAYTANGLNIVAGGVTYVYQGYDVSGYGVYSTDGGVTNLLLSTDPTLVVGSKIKGLTSDSSGSAFAAGVTCFLTGTLIATVSGPVAVENLRVGDMLALANGGSKAIVWIGSRTLDCAAHPAPSAVLPVRVAAHAFGDNLPNRDLYVSPDHAVFAEGVLVPIKHLINGHSITQTEAGVVTYWHVELETHEVILAENLPVESYLENDNRADLEGGDVVTMHPMFAGTAYSPIAAIVTQGPVLQSIRDLVEARKALPVAIAA